MLTWVRGWLVIHACPEVETCVKVEGTHDLEGEKQTRKCKQNLVINNQWCLLRLTSSPVCSPNKNYQDRSLIQTPILCPVVPRYPVAI